MQYLWTVKSIGLRQVVNENIERQTIVLEDDTEIGISRSLAIDFFGNKILEIEKIKVNDYVKVIFNIQCKQSQNKKWAGYFFNNTYWVSCTTVQKIPTYEPIDIWDCIQLNDWDCVQLDLDYTDIINYDTDTIIYDEETSYNNEETYNAYKNDPKDTPFTADDIIDNSNYYDDKDEDEYDPLKR